MTTSAAENEAALNLVVGGVRPSPSETWQKMVRFSGPTADELAAMRVTVDVLMQRGYELVVGTYEHLQRNPDTAAVLGWEDGADEAHLAERRRFFTIWLARTISIDLGEDFAGYLFHAGRVHAAHGPRRVHTPTLWVTGSMGLVLGAFAEFIRQAHHDSDLVAQALSGWNKYLMIQLNQMLTGYDVARDLDAGRQRVSFKAYGMARLAWGRDGIAVGCHAGDTVADVLRKVLDYAPLFRTMAFEPVWQELEEERSLWMAVEPGYTLREGWRVLLNGTHLSFSGGFDSPVQDGDLIAVFPPGR